MPDGWDGPMTGPMRGEPLQRCARHGGWWTRLRPCPACQIAARVKATLTLCLSECQHGTKANICRLLQELEQQNGGNPRG